MPDLAFTIGSKIFACFLHEKASKYDNHHYIQLFSMQKPGNLLQNLFCIAQHTCTLLTELKRLSTNSGKWCTKHCLHMHAVQEMVPYKAFHQNSVFQFENSTDSSIKQVGDVHLPRAWVIQKAEWPKSAQTGTFCPFWLQTWMLFWKSKLFLAVLISDLNGILKAEITPWSFWFYMWMLIWKLKITCRLCSSTVLNFN